MGMCEAWGLHIKSQLRITVNGLVDGTTKSIDTLELSADIVK